MKLKKCTVGRPGYLLWGTPTQLEKLQLWDRIFISLTRSMTSVSDENRFNTLPMGVVSKNLKGTSHNISSESNKHEDQHCQCYLRYNPNCTKSYSDYLHKCGDCAIALAYLYPNKGSHVEALTMVCSYRLLPSTQEVPRLIPGQGGCAACSLFLHLPFFFFFFPHLPHTHSGQVWATTTLMTTVNNHDSYTPRTLRACCSQSKFMILKLRESSAPALFLYNCTPNISRSADASVSVT